MVRKSTPKQLESYGHQGHLGGWITDHCKGRTVEWFGQDGTWLVIRFTDGHEAWIGWQDASGNQLKGSPFLENLGVKVQIVGADAFPVGRMGKG